MLSIEWAIMRAPGRAYADLTSTSATSLVSAIGRPIVAALLIGATMATTATGLADAATVTRTTIAWSFAVLIQVAGAALLVATSRRRRVPGPRAFDLLFAANGPWASWLIGFTLWTQATSPIGRTLHVAPWTLLLPIAWTARLVYVYCRVVLDDGRRTALWRAAAHQSAMGVAFLGYFFWAVQGWPRLVGWWG